MLKRDDMLELTRRMTPARSCFTRIAGAYLDDEGFVDDTFNVNFLKLSEKEKTKNLALAKAVPFSDTNTQLKEYRFAKSAKGPGSIWQALNALKDCGLKNDALLDTLYDEMAKHYGKGDCAIFLFHGVYDVPLKGTDRGYQGESEEVYSFLICTVSPLIKEYEPGNPVFGFLFPAFIDRSGDDNAICIFNENPEQMESGLMEMLLGKGCRA